ncbi:ATP binding protein [Trichodelitschia bisporula]|uniref:GPN-loop GTPase 2 n=1 Tax=Trichodelitschia bisporula TaxID=703511 RepID=A0A6G1HLA8_9PEZI|nr:ATP binding protein [Trichodelitschia bisporula]
MPFAQLVIGPPGSGKSTYCDGMHQFMSAIGRPVSVVNLDPANDKTSYPAAVDVRDLVTLDEIMEAEELGPNGGVLYALEELEHNFEWLEKGLKELGDDEYVIFDCPGQVEVFTHHSSLRNIFFRLQKLGYRLIVLHLTDSFVLTQPSLYISALLLALRSMLQMELPHLNVLTKIDNLINYPSLPFNLDFYTEVHDLQYLLPLLDAERSGEAPPGHEDGDNDSETEPPEEPPSKFAALNSAIVDLVQDFSLVGFETLAVEDKESMAMLLRAIDRASGYVFGSANGANDTVWQVAMRDDAVTMDIRDVQERWIDRREEYDEAEREKWKAEGDEWKRGPERGNHTDPMEGIEGLDGLVGEGRGMMGRDSGIKIVRKPPS